MEQNFPDISFVLKSPERPFRRFEQYLLFRAVIFSDVKKSEFSNNADDIFEAIAQAVEENGVNFAMCGSKFSFAPGGFLDTAIERILPIELDPNKNKNRAIAIMLDRSESMTNSVAAGTRISVVGKAASDFLKTLKNEDSCAFLTFADAPDTKGETLSLHKLNVKYRAKIEKTIELVSKSQQLFGRTNIEKALVETVELLRNRKEKVKVALIFSDGEPTVGAKTAEDFTKLLEDAQKSGIFIGFVVTGSYSKLFIHLAEKLKNNGSVEFLGKSWDVKKAFKNALLKAGGELIAKGKFKILDSNSEIYLDSPLLRGYARSLVKNFGAPDVVLQSDKNEPLVVNWRINDALSTACLIPFSGKLSWENAVPQKIQVKLRNNFYQLFSGDTIQLKTEIIRRNSRNILKVYDFSKKIVRKMNLKIDNLSKTLKPIKPGVYETELENFNSQTGIIYGDSMQPVPIILDIQPINELQNIEAKAKIIAGISEKYFGLSSLNLKITEQVKSSEVESTDLSRLFNILALLVLIFWSLLYAFKSQRVKTN